MNKFHIIGLAVLGGIINAGILIGLHYATGYEFPKWAVGLGGGLWGAGLVSVAWFRKHRSESHLRLDVPEGRLVRRIPTDLQR